jgi:hypothetical protein
MAGKHTATTASTLTVPTTVPTTAENTARTKRSAWRPLAMATVGGAVLVTMGVGVWATLNATASTVDPQTVTNGTLKLTMAARGTGFTQAITNLAPGDTINRYVDLTNGGTLDGQALTLKVTGTGTTALTTDTTRGLKITVTECVSGTWTATTGACTGTKNPLLTDKPINDLATATNLITGSIGAAEVRGLQVTVKLPDQTETTTNGTLPTNTIQGLTTNLTYTFAETQRTATTTNS